ncbi:homeodomain transcription factor ste12, partial [Lunasporangiospora selenospora]
MLYRNNCIRTQKKQKVFYWYSVPHDRLFLDAMERDLKREQAGTEPTSQAVMEPALSCTLETVRDLVERLSRRTIEMSTITETLQSFTPDGVTPMNRQITTMTASSSVSPTQAQLVPDGSAGGLVTAHEGRSGHAGSSTFLEDLGSDDNSESKVPSDIDGHKGTRHSADSNSGLFGSFTLFEGSPTYKKRRRRSTANPSLLNESAERHGSAEAMLHGGKMVGGAFMQHRDMRAGSFEFDQADRFLEGSS